MATALLLPLEITTSDRSGTGLKKLAHRCNYTALGSQLSCVFRGKSPLPQGLAKHMPLWQSCYTAQLGTSLQGILDVEGRGRNKLAKSGRKADMLAQLMPALAVLNGCLKDCV